MASTASSSSSFSFSQSHSWRKPPKLNPTKSLKTLHFLFSSTSNSNSLFFKPSLSSSTHFPLSLKSPSDPLHFHRLNDSLQDNLVENLENSMKLQAPISEPRIFIQGPPWITSQFPKGIFKKANEELKLESKGIERRRYNLLRRRQIKAETEAWEKKVEEYKDLERVMREKKLAPSLPHVKALFLGWFEPLREAIAKEQKTQQTKPKRYKAAFAQHIDLLLADKMALIVMHTLMVMMENQGGCVLVVEAAINIGMAIE